MGEKLAALFVTLGLICGGIAMSFHGTKDHSRLKTCASRFVCVDLSKCPRTASLMYRAADVTSVVELLRHHLCGLKDGHLQVCCLQTSPLPPLGSLVEDASVERGDVLGNHSLDGHPNLQLINQHKCGASIKNRILGREGTIPGEFPWLALLQYQIPDGSLDFLCGGSLISNHYILTAAYCIPSPADPFKTLLSVRLGEYNVHANEDCAMNGDADEEGVLVCSLNPPKDYEIERTIPHPGFHADDLYQDDVALIRLKRRVVFEPPFVVPVCLPVDNLKFEESSLEVAGWGVTESGMWTSDVLLKVAVNLVAVSQCERHTNHRFLPSHLCVSGPCVGDSGGPLMYTATRGGRRTRVCYQVGIVSSSCSSSGPTYYTKVRPYLRWILDNISH